MNGHVVMTLTWFVDVLWWHNLSMAELAVVLECLGEWSQRPCRFSDLLLLW